MLKRFISRLFPERVRLAAETDSTFLVGRRAFGMEDRDRYDYDREEVLRLALEAWRVNPIARRIVGLTTQYVVGGGVRVRADHEGTHKFLDDFWQHRLNQLPMRVYEWCDELTRTGELFFLVSTDAGGMSYVRALPAQEITLVHTASNDLAQETGYVQRGESAAEDDHLWPAYNPQTDQQAEDGSFAPVMLHYAINRPVGAVRGESDLAPVLRWLSRYAAWLEDRARLNRYRNSFLFVVKGRWASEAERLARQTALTAAPPSPGSILVVDESESWEVMSPKLESSAAGEDGLALKKMVAAGTGLPLHFLAEPEGSTKTTAESAGGPTYRHFEQRQEFFTWVIADLARLVVRRRGMVDRSVQEDAKIQVSGADLSARDNAALAVATSTITSALGELRDRGVIDDAELLRMVYRFAGEVVDIEAVLADGRKAGPVVKDVIVPADQAGAASQPGGIPSVPGLPSLPGGAKKAKKAERPGKVGKKPAPGGSKVIDVETGDVKGDAVTM